MKKLFLIVAAMFMAISFSACSDDKDDVPYDDSPKIEFKDPNFLKALLSLRIDGSGNGYVTFIENYIYNRNEIDVNKDGQISEQEANFVGYLSFEGAENNIKDMDGLDKFPNLTGLRCNDTQCVSLDLSTLHGSFYLFDCHNNNNLESINLSGYYSPAVYFSINISDNPKLKSLVLRKYLIKYIGQSSIDKIVEEYGDIITYVD